VEGFSVHQGRGNYGCRDCCTEKMVQNSQEASETVWNTLTLFFFHPELAYLSPPFFVDSRFTFDHIICKYCIITPIVSLTLLYSCAILLSLVFIQGECLYLAEGEC